MEETKKDYCPICNQPYREDRMVECTRCERWCCYECVDVTDDVANNDSWICPRCEKQIKLIQVGKEKSTPSKLSQKSLKSKKGSSKKSKANSNVSSKLKLKLQLLQEERDLLKKERELAKEARLMLDEEDSDDSQIIEDDEIKETDTVANRILSMNIEEGKGNGIISSFHEQPLTFSTVNYTKLTPQQCASRKAISKELPIFAGNPYDWPLFISSFERTTELCGFNNDENLLRLQKCLKGAAKNAVSSFLILPECVPQIIQTLNILYGRPEQIMEAYINVIRRQPAPKAEKLDTFVEFALAVKNLCVSLETAKLNAHLNNPMLMNELIEKLPSQMKINWAMHRKTLQHNMGLTEFANWAFDMATNICTTLPQLPMSNHIKQNHFHEQSNTHLNNSSIETPILKCKVCSGTCKNVNQCQSFCSYPVDQRWKLVRNLQLCRLCLKKHRFPCKYPVKCNIENCQRKHHPLLHYDVIPQEYQTASKSVETEVQPHQVSVFSEKKEISCQNVRFRILPVKLSSHTKTIETFAFLDEGSSVTLVNEAIIKELNIQGIEDPLCLKWTGDQERFESDSQKVSLTIEGEFQEARRFDISARTVKNLNLPKQTLDSQNLKQHYSHLRNIPVKSYINAEPRLLIGLDNWKLAIPLRIKEGEEGAPIAAKCRLGWSVFAFQVQSHVSTYSYHICECTTNKISNEELFEAVKEYFAIESLGIRPCSIASKELARARKIQETTLMKNQGKYNIGLLWKYDYVKLPCSKKMAIRRLECLERQISINPELGIKINEQIEDYKKKGYVRKLSLEELSQPHEKIWYLPIFRVLNPNKPGKFRLVWDAAAQVNGTSLNSLLLKGDDQLASLLGVLLRFRERKIGFSADIKEMFLRIGIREEDQHAQRFLWRNGKSENDLDTYIMTVMTFGATCSPSCSQYVKNINAQKYSSSYPRAVECIIRNHYVDDLLDSADTEDEAIKLAKEVTFIHSNANFEIRNWRSNSQNLMRIMNSVKADPVEITSTDKITEKVLGMWWNLTTDCFVFSLRFNKGNKDILKGEKRPTKREILKIIMSIYDPLGLISFFLVKIKILLQEIWRSKITWDETIKDEQLSKWLEWLKQLPKIESIKIPRCYLDSFRNWTNAVVQLHIFVDASEHASAAVGYLRIMRDKHIECILVGSKTRVAPLKLQTIPRLELDGAVMGSRLAQTYRSHLSIQINETYYWSDSLIVLNWLRIEEPRKLNKYVAYRVAEIQQNSIIFNWRYVPTDLNVADKATKWNKKQNLDISNTWFQGPNFLHQTEDYWPNDNHLPTEHGGEIMMKHEHIEPIININNFNKYSKLLNTMAYVFRFINILSSKIHKNPIYVGCFTSEELLVAKITLIRISQKEFYSEEFIELQKKTTSNLQPTVNKSSKLYKLSPFIDKTGILRIRGRIDATNDLDYDTKRPIILPNTSHLSYLIVDDYHRKFYHRNHETVVNEIRQKFYIPQLRRLLFKVRKYCQMCKIKFAMPETPEMSPLPEGRLATYTAPFTHTGMDYFGPINVTVGRRTEKRWGALFTCLTTRGVHLEVAHKLDADSCILCLSNFINRRGRPSFIYCDRGTNFIATERILKQELRNMDQKLIANSFVNSEISFLFNPPLSPHMGGAWERLVKSVKISLYDALPTRTPTDPLLQSCLITAENIVNSRPLTYLPLDSEESEALTPNHFLIGSSNGDKPCVQLNDDAKLLKCSYLYREQFANKCWRRFVAEYIHNILLRPKWHKQVFPIKVGDIVIICDKNLPRCNWPKGRIIEVKQGSDGQVRQAKVQTINGILERSAGKLAVLQVNPEESGTASSLDNAVPGGSVTNT